MASFNRVVMMGNLTRDPEYKQLSSGQGVCKLGIASNRQFKNKQSGSMVQEVCYVDIDVWGAQAESCRQYLQKGRGVLIEGRLKFDSWEDAEGKTRSKHSIVADRVIFLSSQQGESATGDHEYVSGARKNEDVEMDQKLGKQINEVKARTQAKKEASQKEESYADDAEQHPATFVDEPPFHDDLPF